MVFGRLYRLVPTLILLAVIVIFVYLRMRKYSNPPKAKDFAIRVLSWVFGVLSIIGLAAVIYALLDNNLFAAELFASAALVFFIPWLIVRFWAWRFYKSNPKFKATPTPVKVVKRVRKNKTH